MDEACLANREWRCGWECGSSDEELSVELWDENVSFTSFGRRFRSGLTLGCNFPILFWFVDLRGSCCSFSRTRCGVGVWLGITFTFVLKTLDLTSLTLIGRCFVSLILDMTASHLLCGFRDETGMVIVGVGGAGVSGNWVALMALRWKRR